MRGGSAEQVLAELDVAEQLAEERGRMGGVDRGEEGRRVSVG
jgi:hypothetical protein